MLHQTVKKIDKSLDFIEGTTLFAAVIIALFVAATNITMRKLTPYSLYWSDEVVRKSMFVCTYIGVSAAIRSRATIRIDALAQLIPFFRKPLPMFSHLSMLVFGGMMLWLGGGMAHDVYLDEFAKTTALRIPEWYFYAVLPLMGGLVVLRTVLAIFEDWRDLSDGSS